MLLHPIPNCTDIGLDWIGLNSLFIQGKPLANVYYTRHPVKVYSRQKLKTKHKEFYNTVHVGLCQCMRSGVRDKMKK